MVRMGGDLVNAQKNNVFYPEYEKKKLRFPNLLARKIEIWRKK